MKLLYTLLFTFFIHVANAQFELGGSYSLSIPQQQMAKNIQPLHSLNSALLYKLPGKFSRVSVGAELGLGLYAYVTKEQDLRFPDGSGITTDFVYSSSVVNAALLTRVHLFEKAKVNPYITGKAGYSFFFSDVTVEDPDDPGACAPVDRKNIINDNTPYVAYGAGVKIDWSLFSKKTKTGISKPGYFSESNKRL